MLEPPALGPLLYLRGVDSINAAYTIALVIRDTAGEPRVCIDGLPLPVAGSVDLPAGLRWLSYDAGFALGRAPRAICYSVDRSHYRFVLPGSTGPWRIAYVSCNGHETEVFPPAEPATRNRLWHSLAREHARRPFHLLIHGGDQIYADGVLALDAAQQTPERLWWYYVRRYLDLWSQREVRGVLATVPNLMAWDDHDIFDGWGSLHGSAQDAPAAQAIFGSAAHAFQLFQRAELPRGGRDPPFTSCGPFHRAAQLGAIRVVAPDTRSERTRHQVLGVTGWSFLEKEVREAAGTPLLLVCSTPLGGPDVSTIERTLRRATCSRFAFGDLRDQWSCDAHREEWRRLVSLLAGAARGAPMPPTVVSGEIHVGAACELRAGGTVIRQLISSGIAHPRPSRFTAWALNRLMRRPTEVDGVSIRFLEVGAGGARVIRGRNWLELEMDRDAKLAARWHVESGSAVTTIDAPAVAS